MTHSSSEPRGYCDWEVGDKVVCVDMTPRRIGERRYRDEIVPQVGGIYTVREFVLCPPDGDLCLLLVEIVNKARRYREGFGEPIFGAEHFRRVQPSRKSIEALRSLIANPDHSLVEHQPVREAIEGTR